MYQLGYSTPPPPSRTKPHNATTLNETKLAGRCCRPITRVAPPLKKDGNPHWTSPLFILMGAALRHDDSLVR